tara:strand:+ start:489 stop:737 length:249 start_codon:yes stop_codon:yes gene_type:complete
MKIWIRHNSSSRKLQKKMPLFRSLFGENSVKILRTFIRDCMMRATREQSKEKEKIIYDKKKLIREMMRRIFVYSYSSPLVQP